MDDAGTLLYDSQARGAAGNAPVAAAACADFLGAVFCRARRSASDRAKSAKPTDEVGFVAASGGGGRDRTGVDGFAGRCITTLLPRQGIRIVLVMPLLCRGADANRITPSRMKKGSLASFPFEFGAGEESRTLDLNLGKVALYQLSYSRVVFSRCVAAVEKNKIIKQFKTFCHCQYWRRGSGSNRRRRLCRPLHNHFATPPGEPHCTRDACALRGADANRITPSRMKKGSLASLPFEFGAGEESRTLDLNLGKVALYQLSYSRFAFIEALPLARKTGL